MTLKERIAQLKSKQAAISGELERAAKNATLRAVEKAAELTPPAQDDLKGANTRTGEMKQHWVTDSKQEPAKRGGEYVTVLGNNMEYASYVNDGHRMDRHFVPGLIINPYSGMLEYNPDGKGGIVVGTKTPYVKGLFMADAAKEEYQRVIREELSGIGRLLK